MFEIMRVNCTRNVLGLTFQILFLLFRFSINPIALRKAKILAFLSAIGLKYLYYLKIADIIL